MRYHDRAHAGGVLAAALVGRSWVDPLVLALPRGGVPVAAPVAEALAAQLDVLVVRKIGSPDRPELALGALAEGREEVVWVAAIGRRPDRAIAAVVTAERVELARRVDAYRGGRALPVMAGRDVVVVDDGLATGATAAAALLAVQAQGPASLTLAVPVGPPSTIGHLGTVADTVVCPLVREDLLAVGQWYADFRATSDDEVVGLLTGSGPGAP